jgi:hypothetical protein
MVPQDSLPDLQSSETLGRRIFSQKRARRLERGAPVLDVFLPPHDVDSISVDRLDHASKVQMTNIADADASRRRMPFFGWATVLVHEAARNGRTVAPRPEPANRFHCEIVFNITDAARRRELQKEHANALAAVAKWWTRVEAA